MPSLREQKKRATARDLATAAYDLACDVGCAEVTTDEVTTRAGYSRRTFANYYSCKQEAIVDGFLLRIGLRGRRTSEEAAEAAPPATFEAVIDQTQGVVTGLLTGPNVAEIRTFARMVHEHDALEPYVHAAVLSFKHGRHQRALEEAFGPARVSMFFGAVAGSLSVVVEFVLGPLAIPRRLPARTPADPDSPRPAPPAPLDPIPAAQLDEALAMIGRAFDYVRHGFAARPDRPSVTTEQDH
ncbi:hypothetical protein GCG21_10385 [Pseudactinotalea sp. HY160]|uniref:hypothetical protein n=1 Tax=Pseudactinotalea sp. HY160 TaxID=2654490 RepID=UPI00128D7F6E|nr:hypothetical protein [Pseudactinotalea sp. HY160]MPV50401.1 hypothetical protein [Pseudactinotalea sp. HY160]